MMKVFYMMISAVLLTGFVLANGCSKKEPTAATGAPDAAFSLGVATIASDVAKADTDTLLRSDSEYNGKVAVSGVVVRIFEERGAFIMVGVEEFKSCGLQACTDATFPVQAPRDAFEGVMPSPTDHVTVVGQYRRLESGFDFEVREVHRENAVILARKGEPSE